VSGAALLIVIVGLAVVWIVFIRPSRRRQLAQMEALQNVEPGSEIVTAGGIFGTVRDVDEDELTVEIAPGTTVRLARRAVAAVIPEDEPEADDDVPESEEVAASPRSMGEDGS
jgi:preprotein translocase subunit YajC